MARTEDIPTTFKARTWIFRAQAILFGGFALFALIMGPLFLTGRLENAKGEPATDAGIPLIVIGLLMTPVFAMAMFNIRARRRPVLRICREGIEVVQIGESSLDGVPFVPGLLRTAWLMLSGQGFRSRIARIPWKHFQGATVSGLPMTRILILDVKFAAPIAPIVMDQVDFRRPLEDVAAAVQAYADGLLDPGRLRGWDEQGPWTA